MSDSCPLSNFDICEKRIHADMALQPPLLKIRDPQGMSGYAYKGHNWNGIAVYCVNNYSSQGPSWQNLVAPQATVSVTLEQRDGLCEPRKRVQAPTPRNRYDAGHTTYVPPNTEIWATADSSATLIRDVRMRFDAAIVDTLLEDECSRKKWNEPVFLLYDERIRQISHLIWQECQMEEEGPALYGESLTAALLSCLFRSTLSKPGSTESGLGRLQLKRTIDYMQSNLFRDLRLKEIASVAGLSPSQFGRAFKASTGTTPHHWIMQRRVELAQRLMLESRKSIVTASHMAGFASQSHFTKAFRTLTGVTPRTWLRDADPGSFGIRSVEPEK
jgi:AraC-like DNA-binding protein